MADTAHSFAEGDSVISTECLISPPAEPGGVRVELPLACRGTVVESRPRADVYTVAFEVGDGVIELNVFSDQIVQVKPHATIPRQLPPMVVAKPDRKIKRVHIPTPERPHPRCRGVHAINVSLMGVVYGAVFEKNPTSVGIVSICVLAALYFYDYRIHGDLYWYPRVLGQHQLDEGEHVSVKAAHLQRAFLTDVLFAASVTVLLAWHFYYSVNPSMKNAVLYVVLCVIAFIAWSAKTVTHHRAVSTVYGNDG